MSRNRQREYKFIATNKTIRTAVKMYQNDKANAITEYGQMHTWDTSGVTDMSSLFWRPEGLGTIFDNINDIVSNWDVSHVTDMSLVFANCGTFDQPLNGWNVSQVTNMWAMFFGCETFDKPLNEWNVLQVTNMNMMFKNCKMFNQPLNTWNVSQVTTMDSRFENCIMFNQDISNWVLSRLVLMRMVDIGSRVFENCPNMIEQYKPRPGIAHVEVNAVQVHQAAAKINYEKLNKFLSTRIPQPIPRPDYYGVYIKHSLYTISETLENKEELKDGIKKIYRERLKRFNYSEKSPLLRNAIINSLEYVKIQPKDFKQMYIETFVNDCIHAHEGADGMTCANGALERIIFSLVPACKTSDNPDYTTLIIIISGPELIINSIIDWYKSHNPNKPENVGAVAFPKNTKREVKKADLRDYLLRLYPDLPELIDQLIISHADALDDDDFDRGGKRRNSRKRRKRRINKTRKRQKNKTRKRKIRT